LGDRGTRSKFRTWKWRERRSIDWGSLGSSVTHVLCTGPSSGFYDMT